MTYASPTYVEETRLGFRFLATHTWQHHVLRVAINASHSYSSREAQIEERTDMWAFVSERLGVRVPRDRAGVRTK